MNVEKILANLEAKHPGEKEYLQAVREVLLSVQDEYNKHPEFEDAKIIERMVEPKVIACSSTMPLARTRAAFVSMPV